MKEIILVFTILVFAVALILAASTTAKYNRMADQKKAQNTVDKIREADPPSVSTTTKKSTEGQKASEYRPPPPSLRIKEPPSPIPPKTKK